VTQRHLPQTERTITEIEQSSVLLLHKIIPYDLSTLQLSFNLRLKIQRASNWFARWRRKINPHWTTYGKTVGL